MLPHLSETEYREPWFTFSVPSLLEGTYGFHWVSIPYWLELLLLILLQMSFAALTGLVIYTLIIKPKRYDTTFSHLLGFGIILPFWIACPVSIIRFFDIRNLIFKFMLGVIIPTLSIFRSTEAMYGFCPPHTTKSALDYTVYYSSVMVFSRDKQGNFIKYPPRKSKTHLFYFLIYLLVTGTLQSVMTPYPDMAIFGAPADRVEWFSPKRFLSWQLYANNALHGVLFQMYLTTYCEGLTFLWCLMSGCQMDPVMKNPLFESTSPSDFWGRRWNLLVHGVLKGGVFKPVRKYYSKTVAVVAVFLASGAFHEWLLNTLFAPLPHQLDESGNCPDCFSPTYGAAMVFFIWQAILVAAEMMVGRTPLVTRLAKCLPLPVRTAMVIGLGLPLAHFFSGPYVRSDYFHHGQPALPMILRVD